MPPSRRIDGDARINRDALTVTGYVALAAWGWFLFGFGAMVASLVEAQGISRAVGGLHLTALAAGGLVAGAIAVPMARRLRRRGSALVAAALVIAGSALLAVGAPTAVTMIAALLVGTGGPLTMNMFNPILVEHHGAAAPAVLSEGHAVAAGIGLLAPLAVGASLGAGLGWQPPLVVVVALMGWFVVRMRALPADPALDAVPTPRGGGSGGLSRRFWALFLMVVLGVGVEFCITTWTAALLRSEVALSESAAASGVSGIVIGMAVSRFLLSRLALHRGARPLLAVAFALTLAGWALLWTAPSPPVAICGLLLLGMGDGGLFPLGLALMLDAAGDHQDAASGVLSVGIACSVGTLPFALGALADATSVHAAFVVIPVVALAAVGLLAVTARREGGVPHRGSPAGHQ